MLSDMNGYFHDSGAYEEMLKENPVIYEVYAIEHEEREGDMNFATTIIHPGKVGDEFFMTKGHYHSKADRPELYLGIKGKGMMLTQDKEGNAKWVDMEPMKIVYVPPYHAHRTINTGNEPFVFLAIYPSDAGHDYGSIAEKGFSKIVVEKDGKIEVRDNPKWLR
jgi:glucose-6-phosphate isomerase